MNNKRTPADLLKQLLGRQVLVKLNQNINYQGTLVCLDGQMNLCLQNIEQYDHNNQLVDKHHQAFIRGNNGILYTYISLLILILFVFLVLYISNKNPK